MSNSLSFRIVGDSIEGDIIVGDAISDCRGLWR